MKNQYKMRIVLVDEEGERLIEVLDKMSGITYSYYEQEYNSLDVRDNSQVKKFVLKRMHFIRAGAYDDVHTEYCG
ncbi:hypothetical protein J18TS1_27530 [Oceanobacillus oncorhynchi subsp. incaldanensis]|uniref:hypothetical protein n=1 Tax=Oceanobacillus oncorhynchi TaxID=545501 RepID=UPI001B20BD23|nr:hypothetical protein [Oceanobacillus oncorhynchi]GIO19653.1 hypothetical protein J18TS1_27530 [Oceanobacillus oncorhynchi subsp. incaldanensis]